MKTKRPMCTPNKAGSIFLTLVTLIFNSQACAETEATATGWKGTAGIGPISFPKYVGGKQAQTWLIPVLSINYNETFYVEFQRVGVYLLASDDKKIGLGFAVEPRFGFTAADGILLRGMATRRTSIEGGPTFDWDFDVVAISLAWFGDLNRTNRGQSGRATAYAPILKNESWDVGVLLSAERTSARVSNYFFGVPANEVTALRPQYRPGAGTNLALGLSGTYRFDKRNTLLFGMVASRLGHEAAKSPIAETRRADQLYLGYGWTL